MIPSAASARRRAMLAESLLAHEEVEPQRLDQLVARRVPEDVWLDYKRGKELEKPTAERARDLRRWVSGFANAEGGVVLVGVAGGEGEDTWCVTGCEPADVGGDLSEWVARALGPVAAYLRPSPIIRVIDHTTGPVLAVAVDRAPNLVPCVENGVPRFYLRIGDQTLPVDSYLYADLVLGRRQRPDLAVSGRVTPATPWGADQPVLRLELTVENQGLVWVPDLRAGLVSWIDESVVRRGGGTWKPVARSVTNQVEIRRLNPLNDGVAELRMATWRLPGGPTLAPMQHEQVGANVTLPPHIDHVIWRAAAFVAPSNGLPLWLQIEVWLDRRTGRIENTNDGPLVYQLPPAVQPKVAWGGADELLAEEVDSR